MDILNCAASGQVEFQFICQVAWDDMLETGFPNQRLCTRCSRRVYRCHNASEAALRAEQGECIAVPNWLAQGVRREKFPQGVIGQPKTMLELFTEVVQDYTQHHQDPDLP